MCSGTSFQKLVVLASLSPHLAEDKSIGVDPRTIHPDFIYDKNKVCIKSKADFFNFGSARLI